ncbi:MAG: MBL fold metallo-hydrolase [Pseudomonadota bacterium]
MERVRDNIYVETDFVGCNLGFVVTSKGIVMIDTPQKPTDALEWKKEIQKHGEVIYIINTDHHQDHALGNFFYEGGYHYARRHKEPIAFRGKITSLQRLGEDNGTAIRASDGALFREKTIDDLFRENGNSRGR